MNRRNQKITTYFVILSLLVIGIVYAILQANLQINGIAKIKSNSWDIHFNNIQVNEDSVSIGTGDFPATIDPNDTSKVDFSVTLSTPGDFYEFTVDVVNSGTIDGMIGSLTTTLKVDNVVVDTVPDYLNYTVTYEDGSEILEKHLLEKNKQETYKVRLEFRTDIEELPEATTISTSLEPVFIQADDTAIKKLPYYACTFDGEMVQGAEYTNGQYTYRYMQEVTNYNSNTNVVTWSNISSDGWGVHLSDPTSTDSVTSRLCTSINNKPIVSMKYMFYNSKTTNIDTSSFDTSNVTNMEAMFYRCSSLTNIDVTNFNTSKVTNMQAMFYGCSSLTEIDVTNFDTSNVTNMPAMFFNCNSLTDIDVTNFDTSNATSIASMFNGCSSLTELDLSGFDLSKGSSFLSIAGGIFNGTSSLKKLNLSNIKLPPDMSHAIFRSGSAGSSPIEEIDVTGWDLSNTTNALGMLGANGSNGLGGSGLKRIIGLDTWDTSHITNMSQMFQDLSSLTTLNLSNFDTKNANDMSNMFSNCSSLTNINVSHFNTSNVTNMASMFSNCSRLTSIDLSSFNTSNVTNMSAMFNGCSSLSSLDLTGFDTSRVTTMETMFSVCRSLTNINVSHFNTYNVTNMSAMFNGCSSLSSLDLSSFNTTNVTRMDSMFSGCISLTTGYARTQADADKFNNSINKPSGVTFAVKI